MSVEEIKSETNVMPSEEAVAPLSLVGEMGSSSSHSAVAEAAVVSCTSSSGDSTPATTPSVSSSSTTTASENGSSTKKTPPKKKKKSGAAASSDKENGSSKKKSPKVDRGTSKTMVQLAHEAIVALKDRTGSSQPAISKWILTTYPKMFSLQFNRRLNVAIKSAVKAQRFTKIKASYKISTEFKNKEKAKIKKANAARAAAAKKAAKAKKEKAKKEKEALKNKEKNDQKEKEKKLKEMKKTLSPEELAKAVADLAKKEENARKRAAAEAARKERADRIRRRRFPMEDTKLYEEDKILMVKPPPDVKPRPSLPYFWQMTDGGPTNSDRSGRTAGSVLQGSRMDGLDPHQGGGSTGLVSDLLQVYHFFRGDVHFTDNRSTQKGEQPLVPPFSLNHLVYATEQIVNGNAKRSKMLPPLITHLFVTCLQLLCADKDGNGTGTVDNSSSASQAALRKDLTKFLLPALTPSSWGAICFMYMDAMERYYSTSASIEANVLPTRPIDMDYLMFRTQEPDAAIAELTLFSPLKSKAENYSHRATATEADDEVPPDGTSDLPHTVDGYNSYLGHHRCCLNRSYYKLGRQDPWMLTAEEIMSLLKALTDDCLAYLPSIGEDMSNRSEEMYELLKAKRAADSKFRKVRLAFEGPKKPTKAKPTVDSSKAEDIKEGEKAKKETDKESVNDKEETVDGKNNTNAEEAFKPTATKNQFEKAKRVQQRAADAYEKGIRDLVARTEPAGYDRNFNTVYCFRNDPEVLYVEEKRPPSAVACDETNIPSKMLFGRRSWHVIETTSCFDKFAASLDIRGKRELDLYETLLGPQGAPGQSLRRFLHDDIKELAASNAQLKKMAALKEQLVIARVKCDEDQGRRSGRLAGQAESELSSIQYEIEQLERKLKGEAVIQDRDYEELTGLELLLKYDSASRVKTRQTREMKKTFKTHNALPCSILYGTGNIDGTGLVGCLVDELLELEGKCESLAPWERTDICRSAWISNLEVAVHSWNSLSPLQLGGPSSDNTRNARRNSLESAESPRQMKRDSTGSVGSKRRKIDSPAMSVTSSPVNPAQSVSSIITLLKQPLIDLEQRVASITNLDVANRDADLADDNMSSDGSEDDEANKERLEMAWKKIAHRIRLSPTKRYVQIRQLLVEAIAAARNAHLPEVVAQLRAALVLFHPNAAGHCKAAVVKVLESHGGYENDDDSISEAENDDTEEQEEEKEDFPSVLSADAAIMTSSLGGSEDGTREDWIRAVKKCKTISHLAALLSAFVQNAKEKLKKIETERDDLIDAISAWEKAEQRRGRNQSNKKTNKKEHKGPSEVWANVRFTDEICMAKTDDYPWWPCKLCEAKDPVLAESLSNLKRVPVALFGEMGSIRVVLSKDVRPFTGDAVEDDELDQAPKTLRTQFIDCMAMGRRLLRAQGGTKGGKP